MTESVNPEKVGQVGHGEREPIETKDYAASNVSLTVEETTSRSSDSSSIGRASEDSDVLESLGQRISPALQEVIQIQTTTSICSSASRPPDFEVDFADDD